MRSAGLAWSLIALLGLFGCGSSPVLQQPPATWTTGFWFWNGSSAAVAAGIAPLDAIYTHVGSIGKETFPSEGEPWRVYGHLPEELPPAREYWLVFRCESRDIPALDSVPELVSVVAEVERTARRRRLQVAGIQLDIDSPTRALPQYAAFLSQVRKQLPAGIQISITGLLDWFRNGTAIKEVLKQVDEFVPQFYDVGGTSTRDEGAIATRINAAKWGLIFNSYRKRFRIGISTFGRSRLLRKDGGYDSVFIVGGVKPIDIAVDPAFALQTSRTEANELVLSYRAGRKTRVSYSDFEAGDEFQFILPTSEAIGVAVEQAKQMHGYCAGVIFFRWPALDEPLAAQPDEVLTAAGVVTKQQKKPDELRVVDGSCVAVNCTDLLLLNTRPLSPKSIRYRIHSSTELEYFLPSERMPVRMSGPSEMELVLPPYCGRTRMYLGRAVTAKHAEFAIEPEP